MHGKIGKLFKFVYSNELKKLEIKHCGCFQLDTNSVMKHWAHYILSASRTTIEEKVESMVDKMSQGTVALASGDL